MNDADLLKLIKADHDTVFDLIEQLEKKTESASHDTAHLVQELVRDVAVHARAEEQVLYEACRKQGLKLRDFALEGWNEHALLEVQLTKLMKTKPGRDGEFKAALAVVKELIEHHAREEEEKEMFPKFRRAFTKTQLKTMGTRFARIKEDLRAHPGETRKAG